MSLYSWMFGKAPDTSIPVVPDDSRLREELVRAKEKHRCATESVVRQSNKQVQDAKMIHDVVEGVLHRIRSRE